VAANLLGRWCACIAFAALILGSLAQPASAQQASGISGVVRDTSGGAMPGVTVEAASPALIEKARTVVTDGEGRYNIVDLRPGNYTVTFSLDGFTTVRREGIQLGSGFTANVNAEMRVGALQETITVTGAAPVVDTQTVRQQQTIGSRELEALPSGNIGLQTLAYVTPGFATTLADVGGTRDTWSAQGAYTFYHGKTGTRASFDGFRNQYFIGAASGVGYITDSGTIDEMQLETSGMGADAGSGSTNLNAIPRSGGNTFRTTLEGYFSNGAMSSNNLSDEIKSFGINTAAEVVNIYRIGSQLGGPIMRDRLWFFGAVARWGSRVNQPGAFFNALQGKSGNPNTATLFYPGQPGTPYANMPADSSGRPAAGFDWYRTHSLRLTWQLGQRHRIGWFGDIQKSCRCTTGPFTGADAIEAERGWDWWPAGVVQGTWTAPLTNRLLLEAGASWQTTNWVNFAESGVTRDDRSILEQSTNYRYGATTALTAPIARTGRSAERFSVAYVTGTHNLKVGVSDEQGFNDESRSTNHPDGLNYQFNRGVPVRIDYAVAMPFFQQERQNHEIGLFAQDAWTMGRFTLNLGLRWDYITMGFPAADLPAGLYVPARHVDALKGVPEWSDINPRIGTSIDVFGNGRTAVKVSYGRYNQLSRSDMTRRFHPFTSSVSSAFREWNDSFYGPGDPRTGNYIPDCDLKNFRLNGECGVISNEFFGQFQPRATQYDDAIIKDNRDFLWDFFTEVQHEVIRGLSVNFGYNRNWTGTFQVTDNLLVGPDNYDEFCITVPNDQRLPNAGQQLCGFYDIEPALLGRGAAFVTTSDKFGKQQRYWDGFQVGANGRLPHGVTMGGGVDFGRQVDDHCFTVDIPNQPAGIAGTQLAGGPFCRQVTEWANLLDFRLRGSVPLPYGLSAGLVYRNTPGAEINANLTVARNQVRFVDPARTAPLTTATRVVPLYAPNSVYGDRFAQLDVALNKTFDVGVARLVARLDLYNALNSSSIQAVVAAYTATGWQRPTQFIPARLIRVTGTLQF
jgi:carboxypeptidase family protein